MKPNNEHPTKLISLTDYRYAETAKSTTCSRPHTIRLLKKLNEIERTLITLDNDEMLHHWMLNIKLILKYENGWRTV